MVNSSLAYEILLYLNSFYFGMFASCEIGCGIMKVINFDYDQNELGKEAGLLVSLVVVETLRIYLGRKGCLSDRDIPVLGSVALTIPSALGVGYLLAFQKNIIRIEYIWCALMLALQLVELFFAIMFILTMCSAPSYD